MVRWLFTAAFVVSLIAISSAPAFASGNHSDVTISTSPTHNMALSNGVYSPTGSDAVLNINDLTNALNAGNLEVTTGSQHGDIDVQASFHWASTSGLTLDAFRSIRVNQPVTDAGTGALTLTTNDGGTNGHLQFGPGGNITIWGLTNALTINGKAYTLVNSVASLAAAISADASGNYALAASYDAKVDGTYHADPITPTFEGNFEGLGNAISNIVIRTDTGSSEGFFTVIDKPASVSNLLLLNATVTASKGNNSLFVMGILAGYGIGTLYGDEVSGILNAQNATSAGGLLGEGGGTLIQCSSSATIHSRTWRSARFIGGLAGDFGGLLADSVSSGIVEEGAETAVAGGLVGLAGGVIQHSHASGDVKDASGSTGSISGGLVGISEAIISGSYASGNVEGGEMVGGLVGNGTEAIVGSFATGNVHGIDNGLALFAGGLVGYLSSGPRSGIKPSVNSSYATGRVSGAESSGGLVGQTADSDVSIVSSYATGSSSGTSRAGGFAGYGVYFLNDYWDTTTSGETNAVGIGSSTGITGLTTQQLQSGLPLGFDPKVWAEDRRINHGLPYLRANPPPSKN